MPLNKYCLTPDWAAPHNIKAIQTTRRGGISDAPWNTLNLAKHVGDNERAVDHNRHLLQQMLPEPPVWLEQVHGNRAIAARHSDIPEKADAAYSFIRHRVCAIMTADCLPILLCNHSGTAVAAIHAGWKGLANQVIHSTLQAMQCEPGQLMAWLGPAISRQAFEVGDEVKQAFSHLPQAERAFMPTAHHDKWMADLYQLARIQLQLAGIHEIYGQEFCTYTLHEQFFSYRRDGQTGRMASLIWID